VIECGVIEAINAALLGSPCDGAKHCAGVDVCKIQCLGERSADSAFANSGWSIKCNDHVFWSIISWF
jgi:uncharacterized lipoprotein NlpE involved in copper resistance